MTKISPYERETVERSLHELKQRFYALAELECELLQRSSQMRTLLAEIKLLSNALATEWSAEADGQQIRHR